MLMDVDSRQSTTVSQSTYSAKFVSRRINDDKSISYVLGLQLLPPNIVLVRF